ncbi:hypothetical protein HPB47_016060, partial [Ixodes persulcatus]
VPPSCTTVSLKKKKKKKEENTDLQTLATWWRRSGGEVQQEERPTMASKSERERQKQIQDKCQAILGPRWASWNLGMFLCIRCAGIHRNLGVHISRVKSVNLDTWTPEQVACLQQMGNSKGRAVYEANLPDNFRRPQTDSSLEAFIRSKYEQKKYIAKEWVQPPMPPPAFDIEEDRKKDKDKKRPKAKASSSEVPVTTKAADDDGGGRVCCKGGGAAFFSQTAPAAETARNVLTKESILSLYNKNNSSAAFGGQQPPQMAPQHIYGMQGGPFGTAQGYLPGVQPLPTALRIAQAALLRFTNRSELTAKEAECSDPRPLSQPSGKGDHRNPHIPLLKTVARVFTVSAVNSWPAGPKNQKIQVQVHERGHHNLAQHHRRRADTAGHRCRGTSWPAVGGSQAGVMAEAPKRPTTAAHQRRPSKEVPDTLPGGFGAISAAVGW